MIEIDENIKSSLTNYSNDITAQILTVQINGGLRVKLIIPHQVFEWYVDIFDENDVKVFSNWIDYYGDSDLNLRAEMKKSIEDFILNLLSHPTRLQPGDKSKDTSFQIYKHEHWADIDW